MKNNALIILHDGDKVLFVQRTAKRKSLPGRWSLPSGTVEEGESPQDAAIREAKEELGIGVIIENVLDRAEFPQFNKMLHYMVCTSDSLEQISPDPREIQKTQWLTFEEFFNEYSDEQMGHGLSYLRQHPEIYKKI